MNEPSPPSGGDVAPWLATAQELAELADAITLERFGGHLAAEVKPDGSAVTAVDHAVEEVLRDAIYARHPAHAVLGEETGGAVDPGRPTWVLDPIDATGNYLRGIPVYATLIAVVVGGRAVVGVASAPALGERWTAATGHGTRCNGVPVRVSRIGAIAEAQVLHGGLRWYRDDPAMWEVVGALADTAARTRGFGDFWNHLLVAGGKAEVAFERDLKVWDVAALECIVTEAGGRMTSFAGGPALASGDVLTTNGLLHDDLLRLLAPLA